MTIHFNCLSVADTLLSLLYVYSTEHAFWKVVNSMRVSCFCSMITTSGQAVVAGRSAYRLLSVSRWSLIPLTSAWRAQLCLHMYLPYCKASRQLERMWWIVGCLLQQTGQLESTFNHHHLGLSGVGNVSEPVLKRKESCPKEGLEEISFTVDLHPQVL